MSSRPGSLWRHAGFGKLWTGQTVSVLGSQITALALPLTAAVILQATPFQMGTLAAVERLPYLLIGLPAGAWIDRWRRRPVLVAADFGRAALLLGIPLAASIGALTFELLCGVALLVGTLTVFFDLAYLTLLPSLVPPDRLVAGNSRLQASESAAQVVGPGLAGALIGILGAPMVIAIDAGSFVLSGCLLASIRTPEAAPAPREQRQGVWREIAEGMRWLLGHPLLRALAAMSATSALFGYVFLAVYVLFLTRELGLDPLAIGAVLGVGGLGALVGALAAEPLARRHGPGPTIMWAELALGAGNALVLLAIWAPTMAVPLSAASEFAAWLALQVRDVNAVSVRQALTPDRLRGRVNASFRFLVWGSMPIGGILGGILGEWVGLAPTLAVGVVGMLLASLWAVLSPIRALREQPLTNAGSG